MKYVLILGGVISGIGKGVIASSTGLLLRTLGLKVTAIKIDPYINVDAGTMNPIEHGEVYVLNDGAEADLDLGNYERFLDITLTRDNNITSGKIFQCVIEKERRGDFLGQNVQNVPHVTDTIKEWVERVAKIPVDQSGEEPDICIIELGGTLGDYESAPYIEALRQLQCHVGLENFAVIQVSLIPVVGVVGEQKTKPTQAAIRQLRALGLKADLIACRCSQALEHRVKAKISTFCRVAIEQVLSVQDVPSTYRVPLLLKEQGVLNFLTKRLNLDAVHISPKSIKSGEILFREWKELTEIHRNLKDTVTIALVGKYTYLQDSYLSVTQALEHACIACERKLIIKWVEATDLETGTCESEREKYDSAWNVLFSAQGILVPGGFGQRGTEGKIAAVRWAREKKIPYLGICLGLQIAVIEFARNVCGLQGANSEELDPNAINKVVVYMPEISRTHLGGTMRLGLRPTRFQDGSETWSKIRRYYDTAEQKSHSGMQYSAKNSKENRNLVSENGIENASKFGKNGTKLAKNGIKGVTVTRHFKKVVEDVTNIMENGTMNSENVFKLNMHTIDTIIEERHRHRYEVNPDIVECLETHGLMFVGRDETGKRMEILELKDHPFFVATQYHPEYLSRPLRPVPTFLGFIRSSAGSSLRETNGRSDEMIS